MINSHYQLVKSSVIVTESSYYIVTNSGLVSYQKIPLCNQSEGLNTGLVLLRCHFDPESFYLVESNNLIAEEPVKKHVIAWELIFCLESLCMTESTYLCINASCLNPRLLAIQMLAKIIFMFTILSTKAKKFTRAKFK